MLRGTLLLAGLTIAAAAIADPIVIAHRGACGYLPEHTLEAYSMAYAMGADYIEPDVVLTKDDQFICLHDIHLDSTTDVAQKFPDRKRDDGKWYAIDFTLAEIKTLNAHERLDHRFPVGESHFEVPTFREMIELIQGLNKTTGRTVGIYPELKEPTFHADEGHPMVKPFMDLITEYGYTSADSPIYIQCFEPDTLKELRAEYKTPLKLIQLISDDEQFAPLWTKKGIEMVSQYADGIGPDKTLLDTYPAIMKTARKLGLEVHPYTFRADDLGEGYATFNAELDHYIDDLKITGLFTDFTDKVRAYIVRMKGKS